MLNPSAKAICFYLFGGFGLALLCVPAFIRPAESQDPDWPARTRRRSWALAAIGLLHPVLALASLGLAAEAGRATEARARTRDRRLRAACWTSVGVSVVAATILCLGARR